MPRKKASKETTIAFEKAAVRRLPRRMKAEGQIVWPAVPALLDHYQQCLANIFSSLGRTFSTEEIELLRQNLKKHLEPAFKTSPHSKIRIEYQTDPLPSTAITYTVSHNVFTIADEYDGWVQNRTRPLFGVSPDAKVMQVARSIGESASVRVLDVGAGTGRNAIPLAGEGFLVDAIELVPSLASLLRAEAGKSRSDVRVFEGDVLDPAIGIANGNYELIILAEVVASHFRNIERLRLLFERAADWLKPGGLLLFSSFISMGSRRLTAIERELSEVMWCPVYRRSQLSEAAKRLPLVLVSNESAHDFEGQHLDKSAWPPTGWFSQWAKGLDLYDLSQENSPIELRWIVYRRTKNRRR